MAYLIIAVGDKKKKLELKNDVTFIGRGQSCALRLNDPSVSEQHCQILHVESGYRIVDLGSETGTLVGGEAVTQVDLNEGDVIQVGKIRMAIKGIEAPAPKAAPRAAPQPGVGGPNVRLVGPGARKKTRQKEKAPLKIKAEYAAASERKGDRIVRKKLREGSKIPPWAQLVIAFWVVVIVGAIAYFVVQQAKPSVWEDHYFKAQQFLSSNEPNLALQILKDIPRDDPHYGEMAAELIDKLNQQAAAGLKAKNTKGAMEYFAHNIELFIQKFIDAPEGKRSLQRNIATVHKFDRKSYIRALILRRIDNYLDKFKGCREEEQVKKLRRKYIKEIDLDAPPSYRDIEVEAETELILRHFGAAYSLMAGWEKAHPNSEFKTRIDDKLNTIWLSMMKEWAFEKTEVDRKEGDEKYTGAIKDLKRMLNLCEGYDSPEALKYISSWKSRIAVIEKKISDQAGIQFRTEVTGD